MISTCPLLLGYSCRRTPISSNAHIDANVRRCFVAILDPAGLAASYEEIKQARTIEEKGRKELVEEGFAGLYGEGLPGCLPKRLEGRDITMNEILVILHGMNEIC